MPHKRDAKEIIARYLPAEYQVITYRDLRARIMRGRNALSDKHVRKGLQGLKNDGRIVFKSDSRWPETLRISVCETLKPHQFYAGRAEASISGPNLLSIFGFDAAKCVIAVDSDGALTISQWRHTPATLPRGKWGRIEES